MSFISDILICVSVSFSAVEDLTGAPEMLGGRVKTLHPAVHGGNNAIFMTYILDYFFRSNMF